MKRLVVASEDRIADSRVQKWLRRQGISRKVRRLEIAPDHGIALVYYGRGEVPNEVHGLGFDHHADPFPT